VTRVLPKVDAKRGAAAAAALAGVVCALYAPVLGYGFVSFDDPEYVTENPHVKGGVTLANVVWAFTSGPHGRAATTSSASASTPAPRRRSSGRSTA
jgi:hypothetical protein